MTPYEPVGWGQTRPSRASRWLPTLAVIGGVAIVGIIGFSGAWMPNRTPDGTPFPSSPAVGVVIAVDSTGLSQVTGFTLREGTGGFAFSFKLGPLENATEFSPSHLAEHMASSEPIRVYFRTEDGEHVVYRLEDAST